MIYYNVNYIPIREAVNISGISAQTLRKKCDNKELKCIITKAGQRKFCKNSLINYLNNVNVKKTKKYEVFDIINNNYIEDNNNILYIDIDIELENKNILKNKCIITTNINNILENILKEKNINLIILKSDYIKNYDNEYKILYELIRLKNSKMMILN